MRKELFQFIFSISSGTWANPASKSSRNHGETAHGAFIATVYDRLRQVMGLFRLQALPPIIPIALLAAILVISFPMGAPASEVTLAWDVKNQTPDGFRVFQRAEGQTYDYANPAWPTDGRDHIQTSCTIANLADGAKYYFVVRAYAGHNQSDDSNEVTYMAPAPSPITIVNDNRPPAAEAGANISVNAGDRVVLDGSGSSDPDGERLSYTWIQKSGPTADLSGGNSAQCSFTAPAPTAESSAMVFELKVTDGNRESSGDTCIVLVHAVEQGPGNDGSIIEDDPGNNSPPEQPGLTSVANGEGGVSLTPLLSASEFDDPNPDDYHARTEWRIFLASDIQQIILDRICDKDHLSEIRVPHLVLVPLTEYSVQVRFFDDHGMPSPWSQPVIFTTAPDESDLNNNSIPDSQETIAALDMNGDAISDSEQESVVKSLVTYNEQHMVSVSVELNDPTVQIQAAASIDPATLTSSDGKALYTGDKTPYGLMGYRIKVDQPGEIIIAKLNLSDPLDPGKTQWIRHDVVDGISNCDASTDIDDSGLLVSRYLVDGGDEDADGVANGVIVDLSGPRDADAIVDSGLAIISNDSPAAPGGNNGGCFIRSLF